MRLIVPSATGSQLKRILKEKRTRNQRVTVRLSNQEKLLAQALADQHGVTLSDLFRQQTLYHRVQQRVIPIPIAAQVELGQINAQLSELLHRLRQGVTVSDITTTQIEQFQKTVQMVQQQIIEALK